MIHGLQNISLIRTGGSYHRFMLQPGVWRLTLSICACLIMSACENDLKQLQKISAQEGNSPIETTTDVDVIYSDSAKVKARMTSPVLLHYKVQKPYYKMPKGIKVTSFDSDLKITSTVVADTAYQLETEKIIKLYKNVVATNAKGETFKSDELIWDQNKKEFYSNKSVQVTFSNGSVFYGTGFKSNETMYPWTMSQTTGKIPVNQNLSDQQ
jgi:LPS export ABC transporter protein LptC